MYTKSFLALNNAGRLAGARTALRSPDEQYTYHYCGSVLVLHAESERPWFAHTHAVLTERGRQDCPYIHPDVDEVLMIRQLQRYVPNAMPVMEHAVHHSPGRAYHKDEEAVCS
ncbi:MAG: putative zinc ribbon protein [Citrobacter portucalensis]|nr:putative zinc ribbon protein [Citrobacter portucalensis]